MGYLNVWIFIKKCRNFPTNTLRTRFKNKFINAVNVKSRQFFSTEKTNRIIIF